MWGAEVGTEILAWESFRGRGPGVLTSKDYNEEVGHGGKEEGCEEEGRQEEEVVRVLKVR
jgi:hypothetical protein